MKMWNVGVWVGRRGDGEKGGVTGRRKTGIEAVQWQEEMDEEEAKEDKGLYGGRKRKPVESGKGG